MWFPDYARGSIYTIATNSYTCTEDCWISYIVVYGGNSSDYILKIDGIEVAPSNYSGGLGASSFAFSGYVKKGSVITNKGNSYLSTSNLKVFGLTN